MTPRRALDAGIALLPADRQRDGSVGSLSVADNLTLPALDRYATRGRLRRRRMLDDTEVLLSDYDVRPRRPTISYQALSGGNQQKAQLAKWLHARPPFLLLDDPTRGVDVGARQQITAMIRAIARDGTSVICASADHEQLGLLCDRVLIFSAGEVGRQLAGPGLTRERIAQACYGVAGEGGGR